MGMRSRAQIERRVEVQTHCRHQSDTAALAQIDKHARSPGGTAPILYYITGDEKWSTDLQRKG
jgi:hypothetical protein